MTRLETLNSIYGQKDFSVITETSNEETDPETKRAEAYLSQLKVTFYDESKV